MGLLDKIKWTFKSKHEKKIIGHSLAELKDFFQKKILETTEKQDKYPIFFSLSTAGVQAIYSRLLISTSEEKIIENIIANRLPRISTTNKPDTTLFQNPENLECAILHTSSKEFNSTTIQVITNSYDLANELSKLKITPPPPWVAFESYDPNWWGDNMQGAQGFYNDNYFLPFFIHLSQKERRDYYKEYSATQSWIESLERIIEYQNL